MTFHITTGQPGGVLISAFVRPCMRDFTRALSLACLVLALLLLSSLGLLHGVVHGAGHGSVRGSVSVQATDQASHIDHDQTPANWAARLFAAHSQRADCLVFDQLCQAQALKVLPLQVLPTLPPGVVLASLAGDFIARWAALFQARGPPPAR